MIKYLKIILAITLCLGIAPAYAQEAPPAQQIEIIILDSRQTPMPGVQLLITPLAGEPRDNVAPTSARGRTTINWLPQVVQDEIQSSDTLLRYITSFAWRAEKAGYLVESGIIGRQSVARQIQGEELLSLNTSPLFPIIQKTITLRTAAQLFAPGFDNSQLKQWCLAFYKNNHQLARALGTAFNWPAFVLERDNTLAINLQYTDNGWAGAAEAGILQRATLNTYMPWWLLLGENIKDLPLETNIRLRFISSKDINPLDAHAWSEDLVLSACFPVSAFSRIGLGESLSQLVAQYPLRLNTKSPVANDPPQSTLRQPSNYPTPN